MRGLFLMLVIGVGAIAGGLHYMTRDDGGLPALIEKAKSEMFAGDEAPVEAKEIALIDRALLFGNPERNLARISPDGAQMSFIAPVDGVLNVFVAPLGDLDAARAVTNDTGRGIRNYFWAPNSAQVLYMQDVGGNENFRLYSVDLATDDVKDLTPFENTRATVMAIDSDFPDTVMIGLNNRDERWHDPYMLDLETGALTLIEENNGYGGYGVDNAMALRLAFEPMDDGGLQVKKNVDGAWEDFYVVTKEDALAEQSLGFSADNAFAFDLTSAGRDKVALIRRDMASGDVSIIAQNDLADIGGALISPLTDEPVSYSVNYFRDKSYAIGDDVAADLELLSENIAGDTSILATTDDFSKWIVYSDDPQAPGSYYVYDRAAGAAEKLFTTRPGLEGLPLVAQHAVEIASRDGLTLVSYLSLPAGSDADNDGRPENPVPMVLTVHGGPWARDTYGFSTWDQWLTNRGYATLSVNFRSSTGFGKSFISAGDLEWGEKMHDDLIDAVAWAVDEGIAQEDQVAIMGGSYGGYATLAGLTFTPETFACGVDIVGPSNLITLLDSIPAYWASFFEQLAMRVGDPRTEEGQALLKERSPLTRAADITKPLLIGQGANDPRVKQAESDQIVSAMQENSLPVTYVLYPDEGHGFRRPENSISFYAITEGFLSGCLGGRYEPIGDALAGSSTSVPVGAEHVPGLEAALEGFEPNVAN